MDNKVVLDLVDDAAHVNWGGSWRMPTYEEWQELIDNCGWKWNGKGYDVVGKKGNSIFLPAAGYRFGTEDLYDGSYGLYWSSSLNTDDPSSAYCVGFSSDDVRWYDYYRSYGQSVRPVSE